MNSFTTTSTLIPCSKTQMVALSINIKLFFFCCNTPGFPISSTTFCTWSHSKSIFVLKEFEIWFLENLYSQFSCTKDVVTFHWERHLAAHFTSVGEFGYNEGGNFHSQDFPYRKVHRVALERWYGVAGFHFCGFL